MANFTKEQLKGLKKDGNKLEKKVINVLLDQGTAGEIESYINDLMQHGCISGMVGELIYYNDTVKFYKKYQKEIKAILQESLQETGFTSPKELFGDKWEEEDIFAEEDLNQNLLAWFGFEETVRKIAYQLEMEV